MVNSKPEEKPTSNDGDKNPAEFGRREADKVRERYPVSPYRGSNNMGLIAACCFAVALLAAMACAVLQSNAPPAEEQVEWPKQKFDSQLGWMELDDTEPASTASKDPPKYRPMKRTSVLPRRERDDPGLSHPVLHVDAKRLEHDPKRRLPQAGDNPYRVILYLTPEINAPADDYLPFRVWITDRRPANREGFVEFVDLETGGRVLTRFDVIEEVRPGTRASDGDGRHRDAPFRRVPPIWRGEPEDLPDGQAPRPPREPVPDPNR